MGIPLPAEIHSEDRFCFTVYPTGKPKRTTLSVTLDPDWYHEASRNWPLPDKIIVPAPLGFERLKMIFNNVLEERKREVAQEEQRRKSAIDAKRRSDDSIKRMTPRQVAEAWLSSDERIRSFEFIAQEAGGNKVILHFNLTFVTAAGLLREHQGWVGVNANSKKIEAANLDGHEIQPIGRYCEPRY